MSDVFQAQRGRLFAVAYRMLGSVAEAEDTVQDAWLAWQRAPRDGVEDPAAYLTTVVTRRCLDLLRSARVRRETYVGPWLPEPLITAPDAAEEIVLAESVRMAFLVLLESLSPAERAAFVLHEVFGYGYSDLAQILDRSEAACRQLMSRARGHVEARRPRYDADDAAAAAVAERFFAACVTGDLEALLAVLDPAATVVSDGGGRVTAALRVIDGAGRVARFLLGLARAAPGATVRPTTVNGAPGAVITAADGSLVAASVDVADGAVRRVHIVRNPDKLSHVRAAP